MTLCFASYRLAIRSVALLSIWTPALGGEETPINLEPLFQRAVVDSGSAARLQRVMIKARRGGKVTVAVIGGSITQGAKATTPDNRYGNRVAAWWRQTFPKAQIELVNAGIGATGSNYGALRAERDLLAHQPDFVIAEYAVNDGNIQAAAESLEGLVRQVLRQPNQPALTLLFMMHQGGGNAQPWHAKVGKHYGLPMVSFRDALWPEIEAKRLKWEAVMNDQVHPNDLGHDCAARLVTRFLAQTFEQLPDDSRLAAVPPLPPPLLSDRFEHVVLREAKDLKPVANSGWTFDEKWKVWRADKPGAVIEFAIEGSQVYSMHFVVKRAMGKARVQVDACPPVALDGWFDQTWGGYRATTLLAGDLTPGTHRVRFEILQEKNPGSTGHQFEILGLGGTGLRAK